MKETGELQKFVADRIHQSAWKLVIQFVTELLDPSKAQEIRSIEVLTKLLTMSTCGIQNDSVTYFFLFGLGN